MGGAAGAPPAVAAATGWDWELFGEADVAQGFATVRRRCFGLDGRPPAYSDADFRRRLYVTPDVFARLYGDITTERWWALPPPPGFAAAAVEEAPAGQPAVHPLHRLVAAFHALDYPYGNVDIVEDLVLLPEMLIKDAVARLVAFVLRNYVSDVDGDGGGGGGGDASWGAATFSPAIFPVNYPARSTFVRKLVAWTEVADPAGHRKLTHALTAFGRARRAGLLPPEA